MTEEFEPDYQNEVSIYEKETLQKIEEFRSARSNFGTQKNINQTIYTNVKKGLDDTDIYSGRCFCLRRLRLRTTFLLDHFKTLKPLRYYTLKKKLPNYRKLNTKTKPLEDEDETLKKLEETCSSRQLWSREALEECFQNALTIKDKKARTQKKRECRRKGPSGPCKKVIRKLRAAKVKGGIIESCKCEDGREVTVVIKGICLCDKGSLNNINLNKVCDEYSRMTNKKPEGAVPPTIKTSETHEEPLNMESMRDSNEQKKNEINKLEPEKKTVAEKQEDNTKAEKMKSDVDIKTEKDLDEMKSPSAVDSIEVYKKRRDSNISSKINEEAHLSSEKDEMDQVDMPKRTGKKRIAFKTDDLKPEKTDKAKVIKASDVTLYPKLSSAEVTGSEETVKMDKNISDSLRNLLIEPKNIKEERNKAKEGVKKSRDTEPKKRSETKADLVRPGVTKKDRALVHENSSEVYRKNTSRGTSSKINDKKEEVDMPKSKSNSKDSKLKINDTLKQEEQTRVPENKAGDGNSSMISLYRNKPEEKSVMALTEEELEKIKARPG